MTNKLRSVIEGITKWRDYFPVDFQETVPVMPYENAKQAQVDLLDALIEELEKDPVYTAPHADEYEEGFDYGYTHVVQKLKQAREELSTSLTQ
jgi:hypothetical protein